MNYAIEVLTDAKQHLEHALRVFEKNGKTESKLYAQVTKNAESLKKAIDKLTEIGLTM